MHLEGYGLFVDSEMNSPHSSMLQILVLAFSSKYFISPFLENLPMAF